MVLLVVLIFLGKVTGLSKDVLITAFFGISLDTDAFFLAVYVSSLLYIALYGSISLVVVPTYQSYKNNDIREGGLNFAILSLVLLSILLSFISYNFSGFIVSFFSSSESEYLTLISSEYLKLMVITYPLSTCVGILNAISSVKSKPVYVYLNPVINNISFCVLIYFFNEGGGFEPILLGAIVTWFIILIVNLMGYRNLTYKMCNLLRDVKPSSSLLLVSGVSVSFALVEQMINFLPIYMSTLFGDGVISYYTIASKLTLLFLSLSILIINTHLYPRFSKMGGIGLVGDLIKQYLPLLLSFLLSIVSFSIIFSTGLVQIVFERGQFNNNDTEGVAMIFSVMVVTIPFVLIKDLSTRALFSQGKGVACLKAISIFSLIVIGFSIFGLNYLDFLESLVVYVLFTILFSLYMYFRLFAADGIKEVFILLVMILKYFFISILLSFFISIVISDFYISLIVYLVLYFFVMFVMKDDSFFKLCGIFSRRKNEKGF